MQIELVTLYQELDLDECQGYRKELDVAPAGVHSLRGRLVSHSVASAATRMLWSPRWELPTPAGVGERHDAEGSF